MTLHLLVTRICNVGLLALVVQWAFAGRTLPWWCWGGSLLTGLLSLVPTPLANPQGSWSKERVFLLLGWLWLAGAFPQHLPKTGNEWLQQIPIFILLLAGVLGVLADRRSQKVWSEVRKQLVITGAILLLGSMSVALAARVLLAYRIVLPIPPGSIQFVWIAFAWLCCWLGLDAGLRRLGGSRGGVLGVGGWLWSRRWALLLIVTSFGLALLSLLRKGGV